MEHNRSLEVLSIWVVERNTTYILDFPKKNTLYQGTKRLYYKDIPTDMLIPVEFYVGKKYDMKIKWHTSWVQRHEQIFLVIQISPKENMCNHKSNEPYVCEKID
jgi:hypothetical protein